MSYVESGWGFLNDPPSGGNGGGNGGAPAPSIDYGYDEPEVFIGEGWGGNPPDDPPAPTFTPAPSIDYGYAYGDDVSGVDFWNPSSAPAPVVPASTPEMETGFGSWFGANTGSTGSSELVQMTIQNEIDKAIAEQKALHNAGKVKDKYGKVIPWQTSMHNKVIQDVFNNLYPKIKQYTEEEFVSLYGEESRGDYIAANAAMAPGFANYMGAPPPGQTSIFAENWQSPRRGGGGGGGGWGYGYGGGRGGGRGGGYGGGGGTPKYGGDFAGENPWGRSQIQRAWINQLRGMNRGGIVGLC